MKNKLREIIIVRIEEGESKASIARALNINVSSVFKAWKAYKDCGTTNFKSKPGRPKTIHGEDLVEAVKAKIKENDETSVRALTREFNMPRTMMERVMKKDLGLRMLATVPCQQLTPRQSEGRESKGQTILNQLKRDAVRKVRVFSDEKDFHVDKFMNRRNHHIIAKSAKVMDPKKRFVGKSKFPKKAMMFGYVGSDGTAFPPVWAKGNADARQYKSILIRHVFPNLDRTYSMGNYIWSQDSASCHTANDILAYLEHQLGSKGFWSKRIWPANSPNLNPLDFSIWNYIEERACNIPHNSMDSLKVSVEREWAAMSKDYIRDCCSGFRCHVEAMITAEGGVFEKN